MYGPLVSPRSFVSFSPLIFDTFNIWRRCVSHARKHANGKERVYYATLVHRRWIYPARGRPLSIAGDHGSKRDEHITLSAHTDPYGRAQPRSIVRYANISLLLVIERTTTSDLFKRYTYFFGISISNPFGSRRSTNSRSAARPSH